MAWYAVLGQLGWCVGGRIEGSSGWCCTVLVMGWRLGVLWSWIVWMRLTKSC